LFAVRFMLNDDLITHLFNWFGLSWKLWSNQIMIPMLVLSWYLGDAKWKSLAHESKGSFNESCTLKQGFIQPGIENRTGFEVLKF